MVDATKVRSIEIETDYAGVKKYTFFRQQKKNKKGRITSVEGSCAVLLGKNGSGKSTIARALSDGAEGVKFLDEDDNVISYDSANIHVFDDNFITKNFRRLNEKNLEPIILLGNSVQIQDDINDLEEKLNTLQEHRDTIFEEVSSWEKKEEEEFKN